MRIGIDFDNTIACYDGVFRRAAIERGLVPADIGSSKNAVRDHLNGSGRKDEFTELQGYVYGARMDLAAPYPGVAAFITAARVAGHDLFVVSHKTRHPFLGPQHDLHERRTRVPRGTAACRRRSDSRSARFLRADEGRQSRARGKPARRYVHRRPAGDPGPARIPRRHARHPVRSREPAHGTTFQALPRLGHDPSPAAGDGGMTAAGHSVGDDDDLRLARLLCRNAGLAEPRTSERLAGGRNNRVFRVDLADGGQRRSQALSPRSPRHPRPARSGVGLSARRSSARHRSRAASARQRPRWPMPRSTVSSRAAS